jgi:hypothetical protein
VTRSPYTAGEPEAAHAEAGPATAGEPQSEGGRRILIVSTVERPEVVLRRYVGPDDAIKVVVPVVRQGILDWLANDERAFAHAQDVAARAGSELPAETVETAAGEADLDLAVQDALATFTADEIVIAIHPDDDQGLIESLATRDARGGRSIHGVPVRVVAVGED